MRNQKQNIPGQDVGGPKDSPHDSDRKVLSFLSCKLLGVHRQFEHLKSLFEITQVYLGSILSIANINEVSSSKRVDMIRHNQIKLLQTSYPEKIFHAIQLDLVRRSKGCRYHYS